MENLLFQLSYRKETAQYALVETVENISNFTVSTLNTYPECHVLTSPSQYRTL